MGLGALALMVLTLGFAGLIYKTVVWSLVLGLFAIMIVFRRNRLLVLFNGRYRGLEGSPLWIKAAVVICSVYIIYQFLNCLTPVINGDSIAWYLSIPKHIIENAGIMNRQLTEDYLSSNLPMNLYMLSVIGILLSSEILSQMILGWLMSVLCLLAIYVAAKQYVKRDWALLGAIIFYTMPTLSWLIFSAKMDLGYTMFELTFWALFFRWLKTEVNNELYISALFLGYAIGSKYHSLIALTVVAAAVLFMLWKRYLDLGKAVRVTFVFSVICLAVGGASYLKSWYFTGDPFFPFFSSPELVEGEGFDIYKSILEFPRFFYHMVFSKDIFIKPLKWGNPPFGFLSIFFLPLIFLRDRCKHVSHTLWIAFLYFLCLAIPVMLSVWPFPRHILPAWSLLIVIGAILSEALETFKIRVIVGWSIVIILLGLIFTHNLGVSSWRTKLSYLVGRESKQEYLSDQVFEGNFWHMNTKMIAHIESMPEETRILTLDYGNGYYVPKPFVKKGYVFRDESIDLFINKLKRDRISHIYLSTSGMNFLNITFNHGKQCIILSHPEHLQLVFQSDDQYLYKIVY